VVDPFGKFMRPSLFNAAIAGIFATGATLAAPAAWAEGQAAKPQASNAEQLRLADHLKVQPHLKAALPRTSRAYRPATGSLPV
jgi:hypothetical protein